jgi:predicted nucleic acid-binding Zn ribbon protein
MPTYVYAIIKPDGTEGEVFEVFQKLTDPTLTHHPETGKPVRRVILAGNLLTKSGAPSSSGSCGCGTSGCC